MFEYNFKQTLWTCTLTAPAPAVSPSPLYILYLLKLCFNIIHYTHLARIQPANSRPGPTFYWKSRRGGAQQKWCAGLGEHGNTENRDLVTRVASDKAAQNLHRDWRMSIKIILIASLIFFLLSCRARAVAGAAGGARGRGWAGVSWTRPVLASGASHPQQQQQQLQQHPERESSDQAQSAELVVRWQRGSRVWRLLMLLDLSQKSEYVWAERVCLSASVFREPRLLLWSPIQCVQLLNYTLWWNSKL